jgi:hypothetical protein
MKKEESYQVNLKLIEFAKVLKAKSEQSQARFSELKERFVILENNRNQIARYALFHGEQTFDKESLTKEIRNVVINCDEFKLEMEDFQSTLKDLLTSLDQDLNFVNDQKQEILDQNQSD